MFEKSDAEKWCPRCQVWVPVLLHSEYAIFTYSCDGCGESRTLAYDPATMDISSEDAEAPTEQVNIVGELRPYKGETIRTNYPPKEPYNAAKLPIKDWKGSR